MRRRNHGTRRSRRKRKRRKIRRKRRRRKKSWHLFLVTEIKLVWLNISTMWRDQPPSYEDSSTTLTSALFWYRLTKNLQNSAYTVHKYWDIDTILIFLALYTTTMDFKLNEQDVLNVKTFSFNLRVHPNQVNGVGITTVSICASHFLRDQR